MTRQHLQKLFNDGDITEHNKNQFFEGVRAFYVDAVNQALQKLQYSDDVLNHARYLNFEKRRDCTFDSIEYFFARYSNLVEPTPAEMDKLQEEFTDYQLLERSDIPDRSTGL